MTTTAVQASPSETARALGRRLQVPLRLPAALNGKVITNLSPSSAARFLACPEEWRRYYIARDRLPAAPVMFLGKTVDQAANHCFELMIAGRPHPPLSDLLDRYRQAHTDLLEEEEYAFTAQESPERMLELGAGAVRVVYEHVLPDIHEPIACQRTVEFRITRNAEWTVRGYLDLEERTRVRDLKIKGSPIGQPTANHDLQADTYLTERAIVGRPASEFIFDCVLKPGSRRKQYGYEQNRVRYADYRLRRTLVDYASVARGICDLHATRGPEGPWPFASRGLKFGQTPKCSSRYCDFYASCPRGAAF